MCTSDGIQWLPGTDCTHRKACRRGQSLKQSQIWGASPAAASLQTDASLRLVPLCGEGKMGAVVTGAVRVWGRDRDIVALRPL